MKAHEYIAEVEDKFFVDYLSKDPDVRRSFDKGRKYASKGHFYPVRTDFNFVDNPILFSYGYFLANETDSKLVDYYYGTIRYDAVTDRFDNLFRGFVAKEVDHVDSCDRS